MELYTEKLILKRIEQKKNANVAFVGPLGSGKSWGALRLAVNLDAAFDLTRVAFNTESVLSLLYEKNLPKGSVILYDEAGAGVHNRAWWLNSPFIKSLQTNRVFQYVIIFTLPSLSLFDNQAELFINYAFEYPESIVQQGHRRACKLLKMQPNAISGKIYRKRHRDHFRMIGRKWFEKPPGDMGPRYDKISEDFKKELGLEELRKERARNPKADKTLTPKQELVYKAIFLEGKTQNQLAQQLSTTQPQISRVVQALKKKGYNKREVIA